FAEDLEAVAHTEHEPAIGSELLHGLHHGREFCDRAATQIIAVGESSGQDHGIDAAERARVVPDEFRLLPEVVTDREECVVVAVAAGKHDYTESHVDLSGNAPILSEASRK